MGYVSMTTDTLYELFRRWQAGGATRGGEYEWPWPGEYE
jgi:hypothetical protein